MKKISKQFKASILVVDDYELNLDLTQSLLELMGCTVTTATSGQEALALLKQASFDLILMDIQMPNMDGLKASEEIRHTLQKKTPIIAITAHALAGDKEKFLNSGMDDYISKPISGEQLELVLSRYL